MEVLNFSSFSIDRKIGEGTFGKVYYARDSNGVSVAVKIFKSKRMFDTKTIITEMEISDFLYKKSPLHFLKVYGNIMEETKLGIVYELLSSPIHTVVKKDTSETRIFKWMGILLESLNIAHKSNIYHRDIKETNILWDSSTDRVKFCDFGSSRRFYDPNDELCSDPKSVTTKDYLPPECLVEKAYVPKYIFALDIWSLGVTFIKLLAGKRILQQNFEKIIGEVSHPGLRGLLKDCVTLDYKERPSADYLLQKYYEIKMKVCDRKSQDPYVLKEGWNFTSDNASHIMEIRWLGKKIKLRDEAIHAAVMMFLESEKMKYHENLETLKVCILRISECYYESLPYYDTSEYCIFLERMGYSRYDEKEIDYNCKMIIKNLGFVYFRNYSYIEAIRNAYVDPHYFNDELVDFEEKFFSFDSSLIGVGSNKL